MTTSRHVGINRRAAARRLRLLPLYAAAVLLVALIPVFQPSASRGADKADSAATPIRLHYEPAVGDLGDPMPFFWNGVYHVFYLNYPRGGENRPYVWSHISSRDLVRCAVGPRWQGGLRRDLRENALNSARFQMILTVTGGVIRIILTRSQYKPRQLGCRKFQAGETPPCLKGTSRLLHKN